MSDPNPFTPPAQGDSPTSTDVQPRSRLRRFVIGALIAASLPLLLGAYGLYQFSVYMASLPPDAVACGNPALGPMFLIIFVAPFFGLIGGGIAMLVP